MKVLMPFLPILLRFLCVITTCGKIIFVLTFPMLLLYDLLVLDLCRFRDTFPTQHSWNVSTYAAMELKALWPRISKGNVPIAGNSISKTPIWNVLGLLYRVYFPQPLISMFTINLQLKPLEWLDSKDKGPGILLTGLMKIHTEMPFLLYNH